MKSLSFLLLLLFSACNLSDKFQPGTASGNSGFAEGTFGYDLAFLQRYDSVVVLRANGGSSQVVISPRYQAKVFTSTADGNTGLSLGWINYKAFSGSLNEQINVYGGENRLWLGPEGGPFSLFFKPKQEMIFANWKTPAAIDVEPWMTVSATGSSVTMHKTLQLTNYKGSLLKMLLKRQVQILNKHQIAKKVGIALNENVKSVGYETHNTITNTGPVSWTEASGMPCLWVLDMFKSTPYITIIVPFEYMPAQPLDAMTTTDYFGKIPADRLSHDGKVLYFKADGKSRGKIGVLPHSAKPMAGSYDTKNRILTVTLFDVSPNGRYLNQEWNTSQPVFSGDAVNAYNDGPLEDGSQLGPFYEIESVSPAALLAPKESLSHRHSVFHFMSSEEELNAIAMKVFGIVLNKIESGLQ